MGWLPESVRNDSRPVIWLHAVSVGEFLAARPLIDRIKSEFPSYRLIVSTTTLTGQRLARVHLFDGIFYFPFDWKFSVRRAIDWVKPSVVIIIETELWPNFLRECRSRGIVTLLVNGRISLRSFRRYRWIRGFIRRVVEDFSLMTMQSEADAERARVLGAHAARVRVCGNLKYDISWDGGRGSGVGEEPTLLPTFSPGDDIDHQFALSASPLLIVAGSTSAGEEELLLSSLREVRSHPGLEGARLLIAPRHPERFDEVASLLARSGFTFARRSKTRAIAAADAHVIRAEGAVEPESSADVMLLDTIGELASLYRFAAVVFVGGSLVPRGGHNIIEPAAFARPIIVGPHTDNFRQIVSDFASADALVQLTGPSAGAANKLTRELVRLLSDHEQRQAMGIRAREILQLNRGATDCTVAAIKEFLRTQG
jgi:3-deoxy-D-manno-octulosonic-acid transferase